MSKTKKSTKATGGHASTTTSTKDIDDSDLDSSSYSGTFRWKSTKKLASLPLPPIVAEDSDDEVANAPINSSSSSSSTLASRIDYQHGWKGYFLSRQDGDPTLMQSALQDLSLVDCLSFVNSILYQLWEKNILHLDLIDRYKQVKDPHITTSSSQRYEKLRLFCIGCSSKAEERILRETNCFNELIHVLHPIVQEIELWLIGPEISLTTTPLQTYQYPAISNGTNNNHSRSILTTHLFQGTTIEFFRQYPQYMNLINFPSLLIGFNCGFGNFENPLPRRYDLFYAWYYDLCFLTSLSRNLSSDSNSSESDTLALPMIFFCANDYADLFGELVIMIKIFGMKLITLPNENPYSFASTMIPPGSDGKNGEYSRGNSYYYGIQGFDKQRRQKLYSPSNVKERSDDKHKHIVLSNIIPIFQSIDNSQLFFDSLSKYLKEGFLPLSIVRSSSTTIATTTTSSVDLNKVNTNDVISVKSEKEIVNVQPSTVVEPTVQVLPPLPPMIPVNDTPLPLAPPAVCAPLVTEISNLAISTKKEEVKKPIDDIAVVNEIQRDEVITFDSIFRIESSIDSVNTSIILSISPCDPHNTRNVDLKAMCIDLHNSGQYLLLSNTIQSSNKCEKIEKKIDFMEKGAVQSLFEGKDKKKTQVGAKYSKKTGSLQINVTFKQ